MTDKQLFEELKKNANKDGVVKVDKDKDLSRLSKWLTYIRKDREFKYYILNVNKEG